MTFDAFDSFWWPYVFILVAGWLATDSWRVLGVYFGGRISETSEAMVLVRAIATALVAAVIANLIFFPAGALAEVALEIRLFAFASGFAAYLLTGRKVVLGILSAEAVLALGMLATSG